MDWTVQNHPKINERVYEAQLLVTKILHPNKKWECIRKSACGQEGTLYNSTVMRNWTWISISCNTSNTIHGNFTWRVSVDIDLKQKKFQVQIKQLDVEEETWGPLENIARDVKSLVKKYLLSGDFDSVWKTNTKLMNVMWVCVRNAFPIDFVCQRFDGF